METIDDVRREAGNPRHGEVSGPPRTVTRFFDCGSALKFATLFLLITGALFVAAGVFTLVFPLAFIGFGFLAAGGMVYARAKCPPPES
jgi:hypothetical protein